MHMEGNSYQQFPESPRSYGGVEGGLASGHLQGQSFNARTSSGVSVRGPTPRGTSSSIGPTAAASHSQAVDARLEKRGSDAGSSDAMQGISPELLQLLAKHAPLEFSTMTRGRGSSYEADIVPAPQAGVWEDRRAPGARPAGQHDHYQPPPQQGVQRQQPQQQPSALYQGRLLAHDHQQQQLHGHGHPTAPGPAGPGAVAVQPPIGKYVGKISGSGSATADATAAAAAGPPSSSRRSQATGATVSAAAATATRHISGTRVVRPVSVSEPNRPTVQPTRTSSKSPSARQGVRRDPKLLPNPIEEAQADLVQRQAAADAVKERLKRRQEQERAARAEEMRQAEQVLAQQVAARSEAARREAAQPTPVPDPAPIHPQPQPQAPEPQAVVPAGGAAEGGGGTGGDGADGSLVQQIAAELKAEAEAAAARASAKAVKDYPRPWRKHMKPPGSDPAPLSAAMPHPGLPPESSADDLGLDLDVGPPGAGGMPTGRSRSPGPVRMKELDPGKAAELKEWMERKRVEQARKLQADKEAMVAATMQRLKVERDEKEKAREAARKHAEQDASNPRPRAPRPAWVDTAPPPAPEAVQYDHWGNPVASKRGNARGAGLLDGRDGGAKGASMLRMRSQPDWDAESLRPMPNRTSHALVREARGAKMRVVGQVAGATGGRTRPRSSSPNRLDRSWENDLPTAWEVENDVQVIRVRDPSKPGAKATGATAAGRGRPVSAPLQERRVNTKVPSPLRGALFDVRYMDPLSRQAAAKDYAEQTRELLFVQAQQRDKSRERGVAQASPPRHGSPVEERQYLSKMYAKQTNDLLFGAKQKDQRDQKEKEAAAAAAAAGARKRERDVSAARPRSATRAARSSSPGAGRKAAKPSKKRKATRARSAGPATGGRKSSAAASALQEQQSAMAAVRQELVLLQQQQAAAAAAGPSEAVMTLVEMAKALEARLALIQQQQLQPGQLPGGFSSGATAAFPVPPAQIPPVEPLPQPALFPDPRYTFQPPAAPMPAWEVQPPVTDAATAAAAGRPMPPRPSSRLGMSGGGDPQDAREGPQYQQRYQQGQRQQQQLLQQVLDMDSPDPIDSAMIKRARVSREQLALEYLESPNPRHSRSQPSVAPPASHPAHHRSTSAPGAGSAIQIPTAATVSGSKDPLEGLLQYQPDSSSGSSSSGSPKVMGFEDLQAMMDQDLLDQRATRSDSGSESEDDEDEIPEEIQAGSFTAAAQQSQQQQQQYHSTGGASAPARMQHPHQQNQQQGGATAPGMAVMQAPGPRGRTSITSVSHKSPQPSSHQVLLPLPPTATAANVQAGQSHPQQQQQQLSDPDAREADTDILVHDLEDSPEAETLSMEELMRKHERRGSPLRQRPAKRILFEAAEQKRREAELEAGQRWLEGAGGGLQLREAPETALPFKIKGDAGSIMNVVAAQKAGKQPPLLIRIPPGSKLRHQDVQTQASGLQEDARQREAEQQAAKQAQEAEKKKELDAALAAVLAKIGVAPPPGLSASSLLGTPATAPYAGAQSTLGFQSTSGQSMFTQSQSQPHAMSPGRGRGGADVDLSASQRMVSSLPPFVIVPAANIPGLASAAASPAQVGRGKSALGTGYGTATTATTNTVGVGSSPPHQQQQPAWPGPGYSLTGGEFGEVDGFGGMTDQPQHPQEQQQQPNLLVGMATGGTDPTMSYLGGDPLGTRSYPHPLGPEDLADVAGGGGARPRMAPYELERHMQDALRKFDELGAVERELLEVERAREVAAIQQQARHIAAMLDRSVAQGQQEAVTKASLMEQEARLQQIADGVRQELRQESLGQVRDIAALFVQQMKHNRVAHAEVQTAGQVMRPQSVGVQVYAPEDKGIQTTEEEPPPPPVTTHTAATATATSPPHHPHPQLPARPLAPQAPQAQGVQAGGGSGSVVTESLGYTEDFATDPGAKSGSSIKESIPGGTTDLSASAISSASIRESSLAGGTATATGLSNRHAARKPSTTIATASGMYSSVFEEDVEEEEQGARRATASVIDEDDIMEEEDDYEDDADAGEVEEEEHVPGGRHPRATATQSSIISEEGGFLSTSRPTATASAPRPRSTSGSAAQSVSDTLSFQSVPKPARPGAGGLAAPQTPTASRPAAAAAVAGHGSGFTSPQAQMQQAPGEVSWGFTDDMVAEYNREIQARMQEEVDLLQQRLSSLQAIAAAKLAAIQQQLAVEGEGPRRQKLKKDERLLHIQVTADREHVLKQISAVKEEAARRQLQAVQLYRLAEIVSPARLGAVVPGDLLLPGASPAQPSRQVTPAHAAGPGRAAAAPPSTVSSEMAYSEEFATVSASLIPNQQARPSGKAQPARPSGRSPDTSGGSVSTGSVPSESMDMAAAGTGRQGGRGGGGTASMLSEHIEEDDEYSNQFASARYTDDFEPTTGSKSGIATDSRLLQHSGPGRPGAGRGSSRMPQSSSIIDEVEEALSARGQVAGQGSGSGSVAIEEEGASGATSSQPPGHSGSTIASEEGLPQGQGGARGQPPGRGQGAPAAQQRPGSRGPRSSDGAASDLSVLSADLEAQRLAALQGLERKKKELEKQKRREKLLAKQQEILELKRQQAALQAELERAHRGQGQLVQGPGHAQAGGRLGGAGGRAAASSGEVVSEASIRTSAKGASGEVEEESYSYDMVPEEEARGSSEVVEEEEQEHSRGSASVATESIASETGADSRFSRPVGGRRPVAGPSRSITEEALSEVESEAYSVDEGGSSRSPVKAAGRGAARQKTPSSANQPRPREPSAPSEAGSDLSTTSSGKIRIQALKRQVEEAQRNIARMRRAQEEAALKAQLQQLAAEERQLAAAMASGQPMRSTSTSAPGAFMPGAATASPPGRPPRPPTYQPSAAPAAATAPRAEISGSVAYSEDFDSGGSASGSRIQSQVASGSIAEDLPMGPRTGLARSGAAAAGSAGYGSGSIQDEVEESMDLPLGMRVPAGGYHSGSSAAIEEEEEEEQEQGRSRAYSASAADVSGSVRAPAEQTGISGSGVRTMSGSLVGSGNASGSASRSRSGAGTSGTMGRSDAYSEAFEEVAEEEQQREDDDEDEDDDGRRVLLHDVSELDDLVIEGPPDPEDAEVDDTYTREDIEEEEEERRSGSEVSSPTASAPATASATATVSEGGGGAISVSGGRSGSEPTYSIEHEVTSAASGPHGSPAPSTPADVTYSSIQVGENEAEESQAEVVEVSDDEGAAISHSHSHASSRQPSLAASLQEEAAVGGSSRRGSVSIGDDDDEDGVLEVAEIEYSSDSKGEAASVVSEGAQSPAASSGSSARTPPSVSSSASSSGGRGEMLLDVEDLQTYSMEEIEADTQASGSAAGGVSTQSFGAGAGQQQQPGTVSASALSAASAPRSVGGASLPAAGEASDMESEEQDITEAVVEEESEGQEVESEGYSEEFDEAAVDAEASAASSVATRSAQQPAAGAAAASADKGASATATYTYSEFEDVPSAVEGSTSLLQPPASTTAPATAAAAASRPSSSSGSLAYSEAFEVPEAEASGASAASGSGGVSGGLLGSAATAAAGSEIRPRLSAIQEGAEAPSPKPVKPLVSDSHLNEMLLDAEDLLAAAEITEADVIAATSPPPPAATAMHRPSLGSAASGGVSGYSSDFASASASHLSGSRGVAGMGAPSPGLAGPATAAVGATAAATASAEVEGLEEELEEYEVEFEEDIEVEGDIEVDGESRSPSPEPAPAPPSPPAPAPAPAPEPQPAAAPAAAAAEAADQPAAPPAAPVVGGEASSVAASSVVEEEEVEEAHSEEVEEEEELELPMGAAPPRLQPVAEPGSPSGAAGAASTSREAPLATPATAPELGDHSAAPSEAEASAPVPAAQPAAAVTPFAHPIQVESSGGSSDVGLETPDGAAAGAGDLGDDSADLEAYSQDDFGGSDDDELLAMQAKFDVTAGDADSGSDVEVVSDNAGSLDSLASEDLTQYQVVVAADDDEDDEPAAGTKPEVPEPPPALAEQVAAAEPPVPAQEQPAAGAVPQPKAVSPEASAVESIAESLEVAEEDIVEEEEEEEEEELLVAAAKPSAPAPAATPQQQVQAEAPADPSTTTSQELLEGLAPPSLAPHAPTAPIPPGPAPTGGFRRRSRSGSSSGGSSMELPPGTSGATAGATAGAEAHPGEAQPGAALEAQGSSGSGGGAGKGEFEAEIEELLQSSLDRTRPGLLEEALASAATGDAAGEGSDDGDGDAAGASLPYPTLLGEPSDLSKATLQLDLDLDLPGTSAAAPAAKDAAHPSGTSPSASASADADEEEAEVAPGPSAPAAASRPPRPGALAAELSESRLQGVASETSGLPESEYSMSFDESGLSGLSPPGSPKSRGPSASSIIADVRDPAGAGTGSSSGSSRREGLADSITHHTLTGLVGEAVEVMVGVVGQGRLPYTGAAAQEAAAQAAAVQQQAAAVGLGTLRRGQVAAAAAAGGSSAAGAGGKPPAGSGQRPAPGRVSPDPEAPGPSSTSDDDLGWGDEGGLEDDDYELDLSQIVAPQYDQEVLARQAAKAAAEREAARVTTSPPRVRQYVGRVMKDFLAGPMPEVLQPGQEPLSLDGFLALERALPPGTSEAQHIVNKLLYDSVNEAIIHVYRGCNRLRAPVWLRRGRVVKPLPPPGDLLQQVEQQVLKWTATKVRSEEDLAKVLAADAAEEERSWGNLEQEEGEVKLEVADMLWDEMVGETAQLLADLEARQAARVMRASVNVGASVASLRLSKDY